MKGATINIRTTNEIKSDAKQIYEQLGLDLSTAVNVFLKKSIACGGFPFEVILTPNQETIKVIEDTNNGINVSKYKTTQELWEDLDV